jgi:putative ABC transport system ATP-binding protein
MILNVKGLKKYFEQGGRSIHVLCGLDLEINKGETVAILGRSGSGKSTLLSLLAGLDSGDEGEISFMSQDFSKLEESEKTKLRAREIGIIFQQYHLLPHLSALENVCLSLEIIGDKNCKDKAHELLSKMGLTGRENHFPYQLSGGECQRVAMARSMVIHPKLLLADEPTGSLDLHTGKEVSDLLFKIIKDQNMSMVLVTHNTELASKCDRVLKLEEGLLRDVTTQISN